MADLASYTVSRGSHLTFFLQPEIELKIFRPEQANQTPGAVSRRMLQYLKMLGTGPKKFHKLSAKIELKSV